MSAKKKHSVFGRIMFVLAAIPGMLLALYPLIKIISPSVVFFPSLLAYVFVPLVALNLLFFLLYALALQLRCLFFAVCILINWGNIHDSFRFKGRAEPEGWRTANMTDAATGAAFGAGSPVKVLTFNVRLFDLYNELNRGREAGTQGEIKPQLLGFIGDADADIVCLQEFYEPFNPALPASETLRKAGYTYQTPGLKGRKGYYGNRIYSRLPIISYGQIEGLSIENVVYADILSGRDTVRVYNVHLASFLFDGKDAEFLASLTSRQSNMNSDEYKEGSKRVLRKMKRSTLRREKQVKKVLEHASANGVPGRIILCGDLNEQPISYCRAALLKRGFNDAFVKAGKGFGQTYQGKFPAYRIDYIFYKGWEEPRFFNTYKVEYSDHRPVSAVF